MKLLWCDTETTGLKIGEASVFQIAFIFSSNIHGIRDEEGTVFYLNPLDIPGITYNEEAGKINGYSKDAIEAFENSATAIQKVRDYLEECFNFREQEKMFFVGYNGGFDYDHLNWLFNHYGLDFDKYFQKQKLDVFEQVKNAGRARVLPYLENRKLVTVAKFLHVDLSHAHDAMGDIKATMEVSKSLAMSGIPLV